MSELDTIYLRKYKLKRTSVKEKKKMFATEVAEIYDQ